MISQNTRDRILAQLQNRVDTLTQERHVGNTTYHFCHPMQKMFRDEKDKEINDCNELMEILNGLEFE